MTQTVAPPNLRPEPAHPARRPLRSPLTRSWRNEKNRDGALSVLLIQRHDEPHKGAWALPGGFIEYGEDLDGAAYRVLSDEASLGSGAVHLEQVRTFGTPGRDPRGHVVSVAFMALGADLPDPRRGEDVADARWWSIADLDGISLAFDHATVLEASIERARSKLEYTTLAVTFLPESAIAYFGLIPLFLGIWAAWQAWRGDDDDDDEDETEEEVLGRSGEQHLGRSRKKGPCWSFL